MDRLCVKYHYIICAIVSLLAYIVSISYYRQDELTVENVAINHAKPFDGETFPLEQLLDNGPKWGTFSSGQYFGQRVSAPLSLETGLMWFDNKLNANQRLDIRHLCNQDDKLRSYSWHKHDFDNFGEQVIEDEDFRLETTFIRDSDNPLQWSAKVNYTSENANRGPMSLIYYITKERRTDKIDVVSSQTLIEPDSGKINLCRIAGHSNETGNFLLSIDISENHEKFIYGNFLRLDFNKLQYSIADISHAHLLRTQHEGKILYILPGNKLIPGLQDLPVEDPNFVAYQLILKPQSSFTVTFSQQTSLRIEEWDNNEFDATLLKHRNKFDSRFSQLFLQRLDKRFRNDSKLIEMSNVALSNMLGSIGYFFGKSYITYDKHEDEIMSYGPIQLLTAVPSRSFFPRGFLWDEGFHNILISRWDPRLSTKIIKSWFDIMNFDGWIPREVILGVESLRRVPEPFVVQKTSNANPPAMLLPIEYLVDRNEFDTMSLKRLFPRLESWFNWFNKTQTGGLFTSFRWRGRDEMSDRMLNPKTLTSGFDDYPRATHPTDDEYHIDLRCWMALFARTMAKISKELGHEIKHRNYEQFYKLLSDNQLLEELHWSEEHQMFCDFGLFSRNVELVKVEKKRKSHGREETFYEIIRQVNTRPEFGCVPELGYVTLFPLIMKLLKPDNPKLGILLEYIRDENKLWSIYGIRSLSKTSIYYNRHNTEHDPPYWRGAIWINVNYLLFKSLEYYSNLQGPYRARSEEIYTELKNNLIHNVRNQYVSTNYIWENYSDLTGKGKGSHPFTGWSSLILLIMLGKP